MIITVIVAAACVFVLLLTWGDSSTAPRFVQRLNGVVTTWQINVVSRIGAWRHRRHAEQTPGAMLNRHYLTGGINTRAQQTRGSLVRVLSPVTDPLEQRMFFLWEVGFHTELDLLVEEPNTVRVTKHDMKVLEQYCNLYANKPGHAVEVFRNNGLVLETSR